MCWSKGKYSTPHTGIQTPSQSTAHCAILCCLNPNGGTIFPFLLQLNCHRLIVLNAALTRARRIVRSWVLWRQRRREAAQSTALGGHGIARQHYGLRPRLADLPFNAQDRQVDETFGVKLQLSHEGHAGGRALHHTSGDAQHGGQRRSAFRLEGDGALPLERSLETCCDVHLAALLHRELEAIELERDADLVWRPGIVDRVSSHHRRARSLDLFRVALAKRSGAEPVVVALPVVTLVVALRAKRTP